MSVPSAIVGRFGEQVTVTNPDARPETHTSWTGKLIGYRDHPCVTIEFDNGERMCLPAAWVEEPR